MNFKKLLLATSIAAVSTTSFAMQAMDEEALSSTTGQDGLTINIDNANLAAFSVILHDTDGIVGTATRTFDGAIGIAGIDVGALDLTIDVDAGSDLIGGTSSTLQVKVYNGSALTVNLGTLTVGNSARDSAAWGQSGAVTVASLGSLTIGVTTSAAPLLNIQMGSEAQGNWMALKPTFTGGLSISNFALYDATGGGGTNGIGMTTLAIFDTGSTTTLAADIGIDASASGLVLDINSVGTVGGGMDVRMSAVKLGTIATAPSIGDVEIIGLNLANTTIAVIGH
ncbi:MAG: protein FilA [Moraxellaceae bacterium]|jgi:hypothetical protein|nr:protein FilA [Moraxellaceae bacterium]